MPIDTGGTYFNPQTGHELPGVLGFTYMFSQVFCWFSSTALARRKQSTPTGMPQ